MSDKGDKYGSPFDPRNFGKKIPPEQKPIRMREPEPEKLGPGCGNPYCPSCYPQNAGLPGTNRPLPPGVAMPSSVPPPGYPFTGPGEINSMRDATEAARREAFIRQKEAILRSMLRDQGDPNSAVRFEFVDFDGKPYGYGTDRGTPPPPPREPPESYKEAREKVKDFILKADPQSFTDIVGNEEALEELVDAVQAPVKYKELYEAYGMKMPKGALLSGPPGCGKTMFARAAASEFINLYGTDNVEFISIQSTDIQSMWVGVTEQHIRNIFAFGREYKAYHGHPLLVFMDEAEIMFPDRTGRLRRVSPWEESQVATFLAEMDGVRESCVFMLLATNRPEALDSALLRDGRCDFKITVKRPTKENAEKILRNNFTHTFVKDDRETLVLTAVEALYAPHYVLNQAAKIEANLQTKEVRVLVQRDFLLEDIVSGAMLASIPLRATRYAFARDKKEGVARGVTVADVLRAVQVIYEENEPLEHPYAQQEFMEKFAADLEKKEKE